MFSKRLNENITSNLTAVAKVRSASTRLFACAWPPGEYYYNTIML